MHTSRLILVVEDNPGDVRLMREALRDMQPPVEIHAAGDADQALTFLQEQTASKRRLPSLIFLDFNLPKSGSRGFLKQLKDHERWRLIPVAVLTTSESDRDVQEAYDLHANCYLRKPVDLDGFFEIIRAATGFWLRVAYTVDSFASDPDV